MMMTLLNDCISTFRIISGVVDEIEESIGRSSLLEDFKMSELPALHAKCIELIELLVNLAIHLLFFFFCSSAYFICPPSLFFYSDVTKLSYLSLKGMKTTISKL